MFAVVKTGGKQYKVAEGDLLRVEKLEAAAGETVRLDHVLMIGGDTPVLGTPTVDGAVVEAEVVDQVKAEKVISFVKRRRKHSSKRTRGHRQRLTLLKVIGIAGPGIATAAKAPVAEPAPEPTPEPAAEAPAETTQAAPQAPDQPDTEA